MRHRSRNCARQQGFTYLAVLAALTLLALSTNGVMTYVSQQAQREREEDLLHVGQVFVQAIADYYAASPGSIKKLPQRMEDLLDDKRQVGIRRYLREIYRDPTTGKAEWDLVRDADGGVQGLRSRNPQQPIRMGPVLLVAGTDSAGVSITVIGLLNSDRCKERPVEGFQSECRTTTVPGPPPSGWGRCGAR